MPFTPQAQQVLTKYRILQPDGTLRLVRYKDEPEPAPLMLLETVERLVAIDTTPDQHWLDWIFFQAGGGHDAVRARERAFERIHTRFFEERRHGFTHPETHEYVAPMSEEVIEQRWARREAAFHDLLDVVDGDKIEMFDGTFGYERDWPGYRGIYDKVEKALTVFLNLLPQAEEVGAAAPDDPNEYRGLGELQRASRKMGRAVASKDVRYSGHPSRQDNLIYDDDYLTVMAPLTYATSVRYGHANWDISDPEKFQQLIGSNEARNYEWRDYTKTVVPVFINFKVPMPSRVTRTLKSVSQPSLTNLVLELHRDHLRDLGHPNDWMVMDEGKQKMSIGDLKGAILLEPTKPEDPPEEVFATPPKIKSRREANDIIQHLDAALKAVAEWAAQFDASQVVSNAFGD